MESTRLSTSATALASAARKLQAREPRRRQRVPNLVLFTDEERLADPVAAVATLPRGTIARSEPRGRAAVVVRARESDSREGLVRVLAPLCRRRGIALIVAGDVRLALRIGAAGVHLSEAAVRRRGLSALALPRRGAKGARRLLVTMAAHSLAAVLRAHRLGADAVFLSPAFATGSHPGRRPLGGVRFAALIRTARRAGARAPVLALGGVTAATAKPLRNARADGLAAVGALAAPTAGTKRLKPTG